MLKKLTGAVATLSMLAGTMLPFVTNAAVTTVFNPGSLIKGSGKAVYYYAENGKRYVFPNEKTYFTWYADFDTVVEIPDSMLSTIPIGGNVTYRPGKKMVKITTDPRVYVVDRGAILRHVTSEQLAQTFYNINWKNQIDDIPDAFFVNYRIGNEITSSAEYKPADVMALTTTISQDKGFDDTVAAISIGTTMAGFVPSSMTVNRNTVVTWTNQDSATHRVTGTGFESPILKYGESWSHKFDMTGSFEYHDSMTSMVGTVNVK